MRLRDVFSVPESMTPVRIAVPTGDFVTSPPYILGIALKLSKTKYRGCDWHCHVGAQVKRVDFFSAETSLTRVCNPGAKDGTKLDIVTNWVVNCLGIMSKPNAQRVASLRSEVLQLIGSTLKRSGLG